MDSQVANSICENIDWVLPNHDSFTIHPNDATNVRDIYTTFMYNVWNKRKKILKDYFESIGIKEMYKEKENEHEIITGFSPYCLK